MKRVPDIRTQFLVAGALLVAVTAVSSAWSAYTFHQVSKVVDATVSDSERTTAATAALATALEREDDALLLTLTDEPRGRLALEAERLQVDHARAALESLLDGPGERDTAAAITRDIAVYQRAGDDLLARAHDNDARLRYHEDVNPLLRHAVGAAARVRDDHFRSAQQVASWARDRATRATEILSAVTGVALVVSLVVALYLASAVVIPIRALTAAVEAMRRGDFERRVPSARGDELGQLAEGFNRMAKDLDAFRRANVGEVIRAKETLEATLAALPDAVVVIGPDGTIASQNPRAQRVLGTTTPRRGFTLDDLPVLARTRTSLEAALLGGAGAVVQIVDLSQTITRRVDGESRRLLPRVVSIEGLPDGRRGAVLVLSDVTELVRLDEMRTELVSVASHELRTPLTTLRMTLLMLKERAALLGERDRELVRTALLGVEQLAGTVDEYLDLTRIEAGQLRLNWDLVDIGALVRRHTSAIKGACDEARITLTVVTGDEPSMVRGDTTRLQAVLANVLANALKYTPVDGHIGVRVGAAGERVTVEIDDSGVGVPAEFRERIFEKFFRVEHHREGDAGVRGSGIGLYVAREIVAAHGGSLVCVDGPSGGAALVVSLPLAPRQADD